MATLLSELVRVLSRAAANELRARAEGPPLSRSEIMALATLNELASVCSAHSEIDTSRADLASLEELAAADVKKTVEARQGRQ